MGMVIGDIYPPWTGTIKIRPLTHQTVYVSGLEADSSVARPRVMADDRGYDGQYRKRETQFIGNSYIHPRMKWRRGKDIY